MTTDKCPTCGLTYDRFRTGETFASVRAELYTPSNDPADWKYKRRHTVLGRWHQLKQSMWQYHLDTCRPYDSDDVVAGEMWEY